VAVVESVDPAPIPLVTVVVCTAGRRAAGLRRCIASLRALNDPHYEIVVVDNGRVATVGADNVATVGCRVIHEPRPGLDRARNRGVREAAGELVAFIDDDCEADPDWLRSVRIAFADETVGCVTGRVQAAHLDLPTERWFEEWFTFDRGPVPRRFSAAEPGDFLAFPGSVGTGCNMVLRRSLVVELGGFDEAIEVGTLVGGGGDLDMFTRVLDSGATVAYMPEARVAHHHRTTVPSLRQQFWGYGVAFGAVIAKSLATRPSQRMPLVRHVYRRLRYDHARRLRARLRGQSGVPVSLVLIDAAGILDGPIALGMATVVERVRRRR
jgi:GT2 family glycosyltransferase